MCQSLSSALSPEVDFPRYESMFLVLSLRLIDPIL